MTESLYIHIPFCDHICYYCDFPKVFTGSFSEEKYIDRLIQELETRKIKADSLKTIYIGGGTPTALSLIGLDRILSYLSIHFPSVEEFTVEANPESLSEQKMILMKEKGVNRISLGVESSKDDILKKLNRVHQRKDVEEKVTLLKMHGFNNINLDFIYGLKDTDINDVRTDLEFALAQDVPHLSFYSLQIEEGTVFYNRHMTSDGDEILADMYEEIVTVLRRHGYSRYEVSNFAKPGMESKHNLNYWLDHEYYAVGLGASGYVSDIRYKNTLSMTKYLYGIFEGSSETISIQEKEFEYLMLHLRLEQGFSVKEFNALFHKDFFSFYEDNLKKIKDYIHFSNGQFAIRPEFLYTMDQILLELLILPEDL